MHSLGRLHLITDYHLQRRYTHAELAEPAIRGGVDTVQFRQKSGGARQRLLMTEETAGICRKANIPFIVDDDVAVALAVDADGVHLGQEDFPISEARRLLGNGRLIGGTATNMEQAQAAVEAGADYIGFGPVFPTTSKVNPASVKGLEGLRQVCEAIKAPVIAIGGLTPERVPQALEAGAYGVAVLSGIVLAEDVEEAAAIYRRAIEQVVGPPSGYDEAASMASTNDSGSGAAATADT